MGEGVAGLRLPSRCDQRISRKVSTSLTMTRQNLPAQLSPVCPPGMREPSLWMTGAEPVSVFAEAFPLHEYLACLCSLSQAANPITPSRRTFLQDKAPCISCSNPGRSKLACRALCIVDAKVDAIIKPTPPTGLLNSRARVCRPRQIIKAQRTIAARRHNQGD